LQATAQSLIGTTAQLYWQLAYLNERYSVVQQNLATAQKTYDLVRVQYRAGAVSGLDLTQAEQAIQSQQATLSQIEQQRVETRTGLAVLLHMPVQQLAIQEPSRYRIFNCRVFRQTYRRVYCHVVLTFEPLNCACVRHWPI